MPAPPLPPGRHVDLPGRGRTFVRELDGPPGAPAVVLLHGWTATADLNWFTAYTPLSRHVRVVALDHRGHGRGIRSRRPFRMRDCADDVAALAAELGLTTIVPVGYSMGGPVALVTWRRHPELVRGLVLCATSAHFGGWQGDRAVFGAMAGLGMAARLTPGPLRRSVAERVFGRRVRGLVGEWAASEVRRNDAAAVLQAGAAIGRFDARPWLGEIDVPTAVVVTAADRVVLPTNQSSLAASIPGATRHVVAGDHAVCVADPGRFVPVLVEAVRSVTARIAADRRR